MTPVHARCECGFTVNDTDKHPFALFTDLLETDFLHLEYLPNATTWNKPKFDIGWQPQVYNVTPVAARGPYGKYVAASNVVANPISGAMNWSGPGALGGDPGLQVWARSRIHNLADGDHIDSLVGMGEITSLRDDMLYGSFRVGLKTSPVNGTCSAFFWFHSDQSEIDMEFLSSQLPTPKNSTSLMNLVVQTPKSAAHGYNAANTADFKVYSLDFSPAADYHEYRFDWLRDRIEFYLDGVYIWTMTEGVPDQPGRLFINHWSNGDKLWSGGPPKQDAVMTVSYVKAYFNSTNVTRTAQWDQVCGRQLLRAGDNASALTCPIPGLRGQSISPLGPRGNETGRTPFFTQMDEAVLMGQKIYPAAIPGCARARGPLTMGWILAMVFGLLYGL